MDLEGYNFGEVLQSIRGHRGLTVEELADGICDPYDVIDFERKHKYPTIDQLYKMSKKLNVDMGYFFDTGRTSNFNYDIAVIELIRKYKYERDYNSILSIIERERNNPIFVDTTNKQFLMWHEGICIYYLTKDKEESLKLLYEAINLTNSKYKKLTEREVEILASIAIIEKDSQNYDRAIELFIEALSFIEELPQLIDTRIRLRVLYALSQVLTKQKQYEQSVNYCEQGINYCINVQSLYLYPDFHYQVGENFIRLGKIIEGKKHLEDALYLFKLQKNEKFAELVKVEMENLLNKC